MEVKDRFKKYVSPTGKVTWYFQAFRTTRRGFKTKREAQLAYLELEKLNRTKKKVSNSQERFVDVSAKWFYYYQSLGEQKKSTYEKRKETLKTICRWIGNKKMCELDTIFLEDLMFMLKQKGIDGESVGYAKNTLQSFRQTLNMIFDYCVRNQIMSENPMRHIRFPKYQKNVSELKESLDSLDEKYLSQEELKMLLNYATVNEDLPLSTLFHVLFYTGCRISESLAIQPNDIDFSTNEILFYKQTSVLGKQEDFKIETTKTVGSARRVVVTPLVIEKLKHLIDVLDQMRSQLNFKIGDYFLFVYLEPHKRGIPYRREYVNDHIKSCVARCGITKPFHTHLARHTMASLVAQHCSWDVLSARLGHTDKKTSEIYRHLTSEERMSPLNAFESLEN